MSFHLTTRPDPETPRHPAAQGQDIFWNRELITFQRIPALSNFKCEKILRIDRPRRTGLLANGWCWENWLFGGKIKWCPFFTPYAAVYSNSFEWWFSSFIVHEDHLRHLLNRELARACSQRFRFGVGGVPKSGFLTSSRAVLMQMALQSQAEKNGYPNDKKKKLWSTFTCSSIQKDFGRMKATEVTLKIIWSHKS